MRIGVQICVRLAASAAMVACGRLGFDPAAMDKPGPDGGGDGGPADACALGPWQPAAFQPFGKVNRTDSADWGGHVSADGLAYVFTSDRTDPDGVQSGYHVYLTQRSSLRDEFGAPAYLAEVNQRRESGIASLTSDLRELYFTARNEDVPNQCVYVVRRDSTGTWGTSEKVPVLCVKDGPAARGVFVSSNGKRLYYDVDVNGSSQVWQVERGPDGTFSDANAHRLQISMDDALLAYCAVTVDELTMICEATPGPAEENASLWQATRGSVDALAFSAPQPIDAFVRGATEGYSDASFTRDARMLFYASNRSGIQDLFVAERGCL